MENYNWITPKGSKVEITIKRHQPTIKDGWGNEIEHGEECIFAEEVKINGSVLSCPKIGYNMKIQQNAVEGKIKGQQIAAILPEDINSLIYGKIMEKREKSFNESVRLNKMISERDEKVKKCGGGEY